MCLNRALTKTGIEVEIETGYKVDTLVKPNQRKARRPDFAARQSAMVSRATAVPRRSISLKAG